MESDSLIFDLGQCALDHIGLIAAYPRSNVKCEFTNMVIQGGGPVATALVALSRWKLPCYFTGVVGDDDFGTIIADSLREEGIDTGGLVVRRGHSSQYAFIISEPDMGRRTIF